MDRRRSGKMQLLVHGAVFCACAIGCIKTTIAIDTSRNAEVLERVFVKGSDVVRSLIVPPQPRNKRGKIVCTKDRYIPGEEQTGIASWYGNQFHGRITASGEVFDENANTLAHLTLPMGTKVVVENPENGIKVHARVTDCGEFENRIADLSKGLATRLGIIERGLGMVIITVL